MSSTYISASGYEIFEDSLCIWRVRKDNVWLALSRTPWELIKYSVKMNWFTPKEGKEAENQL